MSGNVYKHIEITGTSTSSMEKAVQTAVEKAATTSGIGMNAVAKACIGAARKAESVVKFWDVDPHMELLRNREKDEAYLAADPGHQYILYFTDGGSVDLDLRSADGTFGLKWIDVSTGKWGDEKKLAGGAWRTVTAPKKHGWVSVIKANGN